MTFEDGNFGIYLSHENGNFMMGLMPSKKELSLFSLLSTMWSYNKMPICKEGRWLSPINFTILAPWSWFFQTSKTVINKCLLLKKKERELNSVKQRNKIKEYEGVHFIFIFTKEYEGRKYLQNIYIVWSTCPDYKKKTQPNNRIFVILKGQTIWTNISQNKMYECQKYKNTVNIICHLVSSN